jgi:Smr domain
MTTRNGQQRRYELDLHGYRKGPALQRLTLFLEAAQQQQHHPTGVRVITGTGHHSGAAGGPVLKGAVEQYLAARYFAYTYSSQLGVYTIQNVHSGALTCSHHNTCPEDSKVVVVRAAASDAEDGDQSRLLLAALQQQQKRHNRQHTKHSYRRCQSAPTTMTSELEGSESSSTATDSCWSESSLAGPTLQQVAHEEALLNQIKELSLDACKEGQRVRDRERTHYQRAVLLSQQQQQEAMTREQEDRQLFEALEQSKILVQRGVAVEDEEEEIRKAIEASRMDATDQRSGRRKDDDAGGSDDDDDYETLLQKAIEASRIEQDIGSCLVNDDDQALLQKAMEASLTEAAAFLQKQTSCRKEEDKDGGSYEALLQKAIEASQQEEKSFRPQQQQQQRYWDDDDGDEHDIQLENDSATLHRPEQQLNCTYGGTNCNEEERNEQRLRCQLAIKAKGSAPNHEGRIDITTSRSDVTLNNDTDEP